MHVEKVLLRDFRNFRQAELVLPPEGVTVLTGPNGSGKTNLLEAVGYLATLKSFRSAPLAALVRSGQASAFVAARAQSGLRVLDLSAEITTSGGGRLKVNNQPVRRSPDFVGLLQVTVFSPGDIAVVKEGPSARRDFLDTLLVEMSPAFARTLASFERSLRQRSALLRSSGGVLSTSMKRVLASWDAQVAQTGEALAEAREGVVEALRPKVQAAYGRLGGKEEVLLAYERSWLGALLACLERCLGEDLKQGVTTVGPHRDDLRLCLGGMPARAQASQGQQRSLALALKLASHELLGEHHRTTPVLLLDDVFSELDEQRSGALASCLHQGQVLVAMAGRVPASLEVAEVVGVKDGSLQGGSYTKESRQ